MFLSELSPLKTIRQYQKIRIMGLTIESARRYSETYVNKIIESIAPTTPTRDNPQPMYVIILKANLSSGDIWNTSAYNRGILLKLDRDILIFPHEYKHPYPHTVNGDQFFQNSQAMLHNESLTKLLVLAQHILKNFWYTVRYMWELSVVKCPSWCKIGQDIGVINCRAICTAIFCNFSWVQTSPLHFDLD